ncbi:exodeoxyribonuclease VII small subunit [Clostridium sp. SYSU_GA19001]|uniref:exodeoxyribonuclease VII small subunit n=1 Tax=Clostridium caldaquaticum TaxID=2940653 RepID=UPI0020774C89|nr:exodeoxyribonuclease VII small subunit [Clostridium caldaquaticum]MCM8711048.1 exodeoxyribonuclease VII small subunit [Clostridium caldaquaticum]MCX7905031.1 exodeoxyribonuclease VII small subunit [Caloramator sp.]
MTKKSESFENMMNKLEDLVKIMESEQLSLEKSMKHYEEGIKLCNKLYKALNDAENKVKILIDNKEEDFLNNEE